MQDYIIRATAGNGSIRAFAATTRETVQYAREVHHTSPVASAAPVSYTHLEIYFLSGSGYSRESMGPYPEPCISEEKRRSGGRTDCL